jgi:HMG box factor
MPSTPSTPFTPAFESRTITSVKQTPSTPSRVSQTARLPYPSPMQNTRMESPRGGPSHPSMLRRPLYSGHPHLPTHREVDDDTEMMSPDGSDPKRRRINQDTYRYNNDGPRAYAPSPGPFSAPQPFARNGAPLVAAAGYRQQLPPTPRMLGQPRSMGPPPQYASANHQRRPSYTPQSATFDESLRLPPLQTHLPTTPSANSAKPEYRNGVRESQAKSVEAMVMTIPFVNKIKVLAKISPALAAPNALSPAIETRGAAIAIEGSDKELLSEVGEYIKDHLEKDASCAIKTWLGPRPGAHETSSSPKDTIMVEGVSKEPEDLFTEYLSTISSWHKKSQEMIKHITTPPSKPSGKSKDVVQAKQTPIALIPNGFSLTTSDAYAVQIPINDSYAPVDHWQWMATLWRGIIGPDLTIYAARVGKDDVAVGGIGGGGVEVRKDCSAIVVRVEEGKKMDEKTARRLGFEVLEFVRGEHGSFGRA